MFICCVPGCLNSQRRDSEGPYFKRHRFPQNCLALEIWLKRIGNPKLFNVPIRRFNSFRICSEHFDPICYSPGTARLNHGTLPTLKLPNFDGDSQSNCNLRFLKNTDLKPHVNEEVEVSKEVEVKTEPCHEDTEDIGIYESTDIFTINHDLIDTIIQVPEETDKNYAINIRHQQYQKRKNNAKLHQEYKDYRLETEKEMRLILGFLTDTSNKGIYECPKCKYTCSIINDIKFHILAHAEKRICDICFQVFFTENAAVNHSKLHFFNRKITCFNRVEDILEDHQYSIKKS